MIFALLRGIARRRTQEGHIQTWLESHSAWRRRRPRDVAPWLLCWPPSIVPGDVAASLVRSKDSKKPRSQPRLHSFSQEDEQSIYQATDEKFRNFLFAAIHTGLRPFCELARLTADDVERTERGMMWRVYSSKTKKTRKIPVRAEVAELTCRLMKTALVVWGSRYSAIRRIIPGRARRG